MYEMIIYLMARNNISFLAFADRILLLCIIRIPLLTSQLHVFLLNHIVAMNAGSCL